MYGGVGGGGAGCAVPDQVQVRAPRSRGAACKGSTCRMVVWGVAYVALMCGAARSGSARRDEFLSAWGRQAMYGDTATNLVSMTKNCAVSLHFDTTDGEAGAQGCVSETRCLCICVCGGGGGGGAGGGWVSGCACELARVDLGGRAYCEARWWCWSAICVLLTSVNFFAWELTRRAVQHHAVAPQRCRQPGRRAFLDAWRLHQGKWPGGASLRAGVVLCVSARRAYSEVAVRTCKSYGRCCLQVLPTDMTIVVLAAGMVTHGTAPVLESTGEARRYGYSHFLRVPAMERVARLIKASGGKKKMEELQVQGMKRVLAARTAADRKARRDEIQKQRDELLKSALDGEALPEGEHLAFAVRGLKWHRDIVKCLVWQDFKGKS